MNLIKQLFIVIILVSCAGFSGAGDLTKYQWGLISAVDSMVVGRHENSFIEYKGKFYLMSGRGINPVNVFDPETNQWETLGKTPIEIHHFQAVVYGDAIYLLGAMTGKYPTEIPLENIYIYYPEADTWEKGPEIPESRRRGSAGTVIDNDKIYMFGGIQLEHTSGTCAWADVYDLKTGDWEVLPDAPHIRDHFPATLVDGKVYCIGGRNTSYHEPDNFGAFFSATIKEVDCFDIKTKTWTTLTEDIPIPTAAGGAVYFKNRILYMGGESGQQRAHSETQAFDPKTGKWELLEPLALGRHGTGAVVYNDKIYIAAGSGNKGGGNMKSIEVFADDLNWKSLFNGKNFKGWSVKCLPADLEKNYWKVENGVIECNSLDDGNHDYIWLFNENEYADFELKLKFQAYKESPGNSGVQIRSRYNKNENAEGGFWLDGPQVDIHPPAPWRTGLIYDETWGEKRWIYPSLENWKIEQSNTHHKTIFTDKEGEWNDLVIVCKGTRIQTFLNNIPVADYNGEDVLTNDAHIAANAGLKGNIALQLHMKDKLKIHFKNIFIREL
jgi:hypothetical protein